MPSGPQALAPGGTETLDTFVENDNPGAVQIGLNATVPVGWTAVFDSSHFVLGPRSPSEGNATVRKLSLVAPPETSVPGSGYLVVQALAQCVGGGQSVAREAVSLEIAQPAPALVAAGVAVVAVGAVAVALWRLQRTRASIRLVAGQPMVEVEPGGSVSIPLRLENRRTRPEVIHLRFEEAPLGWNTFLPLHEARLEPGESADLWLLVRPPRYAAEGAEARIVVRAAPRQTSPVAPVVVHVRVRRRPAA